MKKNTKMAGLLAATALVAATTGCQTKKQVVEDSFADDAVATIIGVTLHPHTGQKMLYADMDGDMTTAELGAIPSLVDSYAMKIVDADLENMFLPGVSIPVKSLKGIFGPTMVKRPGDDVTKLRFLSRRSLQK